jgi:hypothetical protein
MPLVGKVMGTVVERWLSKPTLNAPLPVTMGSIVEMGDVECIYEFPPDAE